MTDFHRNNLGEQAKFFYDRLLSMIEAGTLDGRYLLIAKDTDNAMNDVYDAMTAIRNDRPDLFFLNRETRCTMYRDLVIVSNKPLYTKEQTIRINRVLGRVLNELCEGTEHLSLVEKEKTIYSRLTKRMKYEDNGEEHNQNIVGPVLLNRGVCEGFASLLTLALRRVGIPCIKVIGCGNGELHAWNMAWIGGIPYHLDVTWDATSGRENSHIYFNLTDDICRSTLHVPHTKGLPSCNDSRYSPFRY